MKWRSEIVVAAWALGLVVPWRALPAQQGSPDGVDPACACYATPGEGEKPGSGSSDRRWLLAGAAGLALLAGVPWGGGSAAGIPLAGGLAGTPVTVAAPAPHETPVARAEPQPPTAGEAAPVVGASPAPVDVAPLPAVEQRHGIVPPRTATHLPLLAAAGVLMVGAGALLSRKRSRERRRRRRFVAI